MRDLAGPQGQGDGPIGNKLKPPATNFTSAETTARSQDELRNTIENGVPKTGMKVFKKQLTKAEIKDLLAYTLPLRK